MEEIVEPNVPQENRGKTTNQRTNKPAQDKRGGKGGGGSAKLRGRPNDAPEVRLSKTLSWILRHGAQSEKLPMRPDGYVKVDDLLCNPKLEGLSLASLQEIAAADKKQRYNLIKEEDGESETWLIRANQGHSLKSVEVELQPINSVSDIPSGAAIHGTTRKAWPSIAQQGLSKMTRNHIHLAQGLAGGEGVVSGMRNSSSIIIHINVAKALAAGIPFLLSANGVVLTPGDSKGFLGSEFFEKVVDKQGHAIKGWQESIRKEVSEGK